MEYYIYIIWLAQLIITVKTREYQHQLPTVPTYVQHLTWFRCEQKTQKRWPLQKNWKHWVAFLYMSNEISPFSEVNNI